MVAGGKHFAIAHSQIPLVRAEHEELPPAIFVSIWIVSARQVRDWYCELTERIWRREERVMLSRVWGWPAVVRIWIYHLCLFG